MEWWLSHKLPVGCELEAKSLSQKKKRIFFPFSPSGPPVSPSSSPCEPLLPVGSSLSLNVTVTAPPTTRCTFFVQCFQKNVKVFEEDSGGESGQEPPGGGDVRQGHFEHAGHPRTV